jgi:hypothetical protein
MNRQPSYLPSVLILAAWLGLSIVVIKLSGGAALSFLTIMPGIIVAANLAAWAHDAQHERFAKARGLEVVYRPNVHGNGSMSQGYRDPQSGEWPVIDKGPTSEKL